MTVKNPALLPLFAELKELLVLFADRFAVRDAEEGHYGLLSEVNIAPAGKPRHEPWFVGLIVQKHYVGFYYMPIYTDADIRARLGAELLSTQRGKSCFYIKRLTPALREQIISALEIGLEVYRAKGWVGSSQAAPGATA